MYFFCHCGVIFSDDFCNLGRRWRDKSFMETQLKLIILGTITHTRSPLKDGCLQSLRGNCNYSVSRLNQYIYDGCPVSLIRLFAIFLIRELSYCFFLYNRRCSGKWGRVGPLKYFYPEGSYLFC